MINITERAKQELKRLLSQKVSSFWFLLIIPIAPLSYTLAANLGDKIMYFIYVSS